MTSESVRVGRWIARTNAEGPGTRFAVWTQGCTIRCPGCFNPHLWSSRGGTSTSPVALAALVPPDVAGVTLLGGEPFEQAAALADFARLIQARGQSVMTFTGYTLQDLRARDDFGTAALLSQTDLLIDGPFKADAIDEQRPWVGSTNQGIHALTERYERVVKDLSPVRDRLEVRVSPDGHVSANGWATVAQLESILGDLGRRESRSRNLPLA